MHSKNREQEHLLTANAEKVKLLNNYFCCVFTMDCNVIDSSRLPEKVPNILSPVCFTPELVLKHTKKLKANSSGGTVVLMDCLLTSSKLPQILLLYHYRLHLTDHCRLVYYSGHLEICFCCPSIQEWVTWWSIPCNYRPISLICIACKLMEAGIKDALPVYLRKHKSLTLVSMVSWPENRQLYALTRV